DHVQTRVDAWIDPFGHFETSGFQIAQASFSMADGGLTGTGLGRGQPDRVPIVESDFIFSAIGEELGLAGSTAILMAFLVLIGSGLRIALRADHPFEKLLAVGLTTLLGLQAFIIIGGVIRLVPLTGITLPFVSYGGSALVSNYVVLALLMRLSHEQRMAR
ncbi:MAG: FtsW/RodA/SpoVE family cell cycle protein, partial [Actinobacteria bacterium]|nr:FtsW/RodA/SpoVE family cell cycle protein [Actinomycetota bacterium]NIS28898.1 FtsW/RodA/SpoVE family cell cycle protein [Actinomycetota bacterium]NIT94236.1 FtsW/RodA/SpoVE family cell cycle protein [Actinomycetota bacterium]NIU17842.1 FtsW/RodA/SpoVE family cell cycle protein [Actinomycetota bacterium]NIU64334.1 FtsW/RodA/SpoVE family cell cycle protein [Actinomycetota bacterium]